MSAAGTSASRAVELPQGTIRYRESGAGRPALFLHGLLVDGRLWRKVVPRLEGEMRCIVPDLPLGSHRVPMSRDADLSPPGIARILDELTAALDLRDLTVVANDTGGAITQIWAANLPERIGRVVLTNCDAFENFLPPAFRPLQYSAKVPGMLTGVMQGMRLGALRRLPIAYGWLGKRLDDDLVADWVRPYLDDRGVRRDTIKVLRGIDKRQTIEAANGLRQFDRPVLLAWAREDRFFKPSFAERLRDAIPGARLEWIEDSWAFVPEDQPERLAELIADFAGGAAPAA